MGIAIPDSTESPDTKAGKEATGVKIRSISSTSVKERAKNNPKSTAEDGVLPCKDFGENAGR